MSTASLLNLVVEAVRTQPGRSEVAVRRHTWPAVNSPAKLMKRRCRLVHPGEGNSDGVDYQFAKWNPAKLTRHALSSGEDESCDEDVGWPSSHKYRKKSAVRKAARGHIERQPFSSDEEQLVSGRFNKQKERVVKGKVVARRVRSRLFYEDDSSSENEKEECTSGGQRKVKRCMGDDEEARIKHIKLEEQELLMPSASPQTGLKASVDNYCIVSTHKDGDLLKVYISKHMPERMYPHLLHWFPYTPDKNNLLGTIDLAQHPPEDVRSIIDFFSPQKPWCRSTYSHNDPHCECCAPFMRWCAKQVQDTKTQVLISHTMIPAVMPKGFTEVMYRRYLHFLKHPEQRPDPFPIRPRRNPNKFYHCR